MSQSLQPQTTPPFGEQVASVEEAYAACRRAVRMSVEVLVGGSGELTMAVIKGG